MAMARQRAQQRLEQQQQLDAERRRKLLSAAETMSAAQVAATATAEGLKLEGSDNLSGFKGVFVRDASLRKPYQAVHADESMGYYTSAEEAALAYTRHCKARADAEAAEAEAAAEEEHRAWEERAISRGLGAQRRAIEFGLMHTRRAKSGLLADLPLPRGRLAPDEKMLWSQELEARMGSYMPGCTMPESDPSWRDGVRHGMRRRLYLSITSRHGDLRQEWETDPARANEPCRLCMRMSEELRARGACDLWGFTQCDCVTASRICMLPRARGSSGVTASGPAPTECPRVEGASTVPWVSN